MECQGNGGRQERRRAMITLYSYLRPMGTRPRSCEETGLPYEIVRVDLASGENLQPDFLADQPSARSRP